MFQDAGRNDQLTDLLRRHLFGMPAHHEMDLVRRAIDLREQALQIDRAAGAGRGDDKFHPPKESHSARKH